MLNLPSPKTVTAISYALIATLFVAGCQNNATTAPILNGVLSPAGQEKVGGTEWVGRTVTPFTLTDTNGKSVSIADSLGKKPVVLIFYRGNWCPFCHAQMDELTAVKDKFAAAGASVYAISSEETSALKSMQTAHKLDWVTFLSDPKGEAAKQFGGQYPGQATLKPVTLVIDKNKKVVYSYTNEDYKVRATTQEMLDAAAKAK